MPLLEKIYPNVFPSACIALVLYVFVLGGIWDGVQVSLSGARCKFREYMIVLKAWEIGEFSSTQH
jgi:hypothetical protein